VSPREPFVEVIDVLTPRSGRLMLDRAALKKIGFTVVTIGTGDRV
jgi:hypothetical protein